MLTKLSQFLVALLFIICSPTFAQTKGLPDFSSATFVRITSLDDLQDGAFILIGGTDSKDESLYTMTNKENKNKLQARLIPNGIPSILSPNNAAEVWTLHTKAQGFSILTSDKKKAISAKARDLYLSDPNNGDTWTIKGYEGNRFLICNNTDKERSIGLAVYDANSSYFGYFTKTGADKPGVILYKYAGPAEEKKGEATLPANGQRVAIASTQNQLLHKAPSVDVSDVLLCDGSLASGDYSVWTAKVNNEHFMLMDISEAYLQYNLSNEKAENLWQILNGRIATLEASPRFLLEKDGVFFLSSKVQDGNTCIFRKVQNNPTSEIKEGLRILQGGWSASLLANIEWEEGGNLDLSHITLPRYPQSFKKRSKTSNQITYIAEDQIGSIPTSWTLIATNKQLIRGGELTDRSEVSIGKSLNADAGQLTYSRQLIDKNWETLCIPFTAVVPDGFQAEELQSYADSQLKFTPTNTITANVPVIIRSTGAKTILILTNTGGDFITDMAPKAAFRSNYGALKINQTDEAYFLGNEGQSFVKAAKDSKLSPFRAYIHIEAAPSRIRINPYTEQKY